MLTKHEFRELLGPLRYPVSIAYYLVRFPESARFAPAWMLSLLRGRSALEDQVPWIPYVARAWLSSHLKPSMRVFEYGSGGSTVFLGRRVKQVISVEHDPTWCARLRQVLAEEHLTNCELLLREPARQPLPCGVNGRSYASSKPEYARMSFENYVRAIDAYPDESFDLVVVDGRARTSCLLHAVAKVRVGGRLVLDNSDNREYAETMNALNDYPRTDLRGFGPYWPPAWWRTSVWAKTAAWQPGRVKSGTAEPDTAAPAAR